MNPEIKKWLKILRTRYAIVGSDGSVDPTDEEINNKNIYTIECGGPLKIALIAAKKRRQNSR